MLETDVMSESNEIDLVKYGVLWQLLGAEALDATGHQQRQ